MSYGRGKNPNSLKNLRPFKPGNPGGGRPPKGDCIIEIARNLLQEKAEFLDGTRKDMTWEQLVARTWLERCVVSDKALGEMLERFYGRVPLPVEGNMKGKMVIEVVYDGSRAGEGGT